MSEINQRYRALRKMLKLTQTAFGEKLGVSLDVIANIELNRTTPAESMNKLVCYVYSVNPYWLMTGEGAPLLEKDAPSDLEKQLRVVMKGMDEFKISTILSLLRMPDDWWSAWKEEILKHQNESV